MVDESTKKRRTINCKKKECMVISKKRKIPEYKINIYDKAVKQVENFNYLGSLMTSDGRTDSEIKKRIGMAKDTFQKIGKLLRDRKMSNGNQTKSASLLCVLRPYIRQ